MPRLTTAVRIASDTGEPNPAPGVPPPPDPTHEMPPLTTAVRIASYTRAPVVAERRLIRRWEWHEVADLPAPAQQLFTSSAHVLYTVRPGLLRAPPPVHRYPVTPAGLPPLPVPDRGPQGLPGRAALPFTGR
ncbi:hypothetical protein ACW4TU_01045 [Streptomyces sp. QTS52]